MFISTKELISTLTKVQMFRTGFLWPCPSAPAVQATGVSVKQSNPFHFLLAYQCGHSDGQFDAPYLNGLIYASLLLQLRRVPGWPM